MTPDCGRGTEVHPTSEREIAAATSVFMLSLAELLVGQFVREKPALHAAWRNNRTIALLLDDFDVEIAIVIQWRLCRTATLAQGHEGQHQRQRQTFD